MDDRDTLASLKRRVLDFRDERAWKVFHTPKNLAMALAIEAGELQELFLWKEDPEILDLLTADSFGSRVQEELADILDLFIVPGRGHRNRPFRSRQSQACEKPGQVSGFQKLREQ